MKCTSHPEVEAKWECVSCHGSFCENCVTMVGGRAAQAAVCPVCHGKCEDVTRAEETIISREPSFWEKLPSIFAYPLQKDGPFVLVAGAVFFAAAEFVINLSVLFGAAFSVLITGYLCRYFLSVVYRSAQGKSAPPTWPDFDPQSFFSESVEAMFKFVAPAILSYVPAVAYFILGPKEPNTVFMLLVALGCLYYPMALAAVAVFDYFGALNPLPIFRYMSRTLLPYPVTSVIFMTLLSLNYLREIYLPIPIFAVGALIRWVIVLYFWTMTMHLLGMFYYTHRRELQWM